MKNPYPPGKLPAEHLARLLTRYAPSAPCVILGPGVGRHLLRRACLLRNSFFGKPKTPPALFLIE
ncbi:MAG: hypothetical protein U9R15_08830 [Chloroflexota bacterium]|nr:hypothetical protein [Chloroflexota bacterium]